MVIRLQLSPSVISEKVPQWRGANFGSFIESWPNATRTGALIVQGLNHWVFVPKLCQMYGKKPWGFERWDSEKPIKSGGMNIHDYLLPGTYFHLVFLCEHRITRVSNRKTCWLRKGRGDIRGDIQRMKAGHLGKTMKNPSRILRG